MMKKKRGPKSEPVDKLRTLCALAAVDNLCPDVLKLEERNKIWRWRNTKVAMNSVSLSLICNNILRAPAMGGQEIASKIKKAYWAGLNDLPLWSAFDLHEAHSIPLLIAERLNIGIPRMTALDASQAVLKASSPALWKLAAITGSFIYHQCYSGPDPDAELPDNPDVVSMLINILPVAKSDLALIGITPHQWAVCVRDQVLYYSPNKSTLLVSLIFDRLVFPVCK